MRLLFWKIQQIVLFSVLCSLISCSHVKKSEPGEAIKRNAAGIRPQEGGSLHTEDTYLWLEDIEGERAISWVKERNKSSESLRRDPRFETFKSNALRVLTSPDRIPYGRLRHDYVYNFWQDDRHVRGLWRRTPVSEYRKKNPKWELLLDLDALAKAEKENWVFKGSDCLPRSRRHCLIHLSRGGKDATVIREFDIESRQFVNGGFQLAEAKSRVAWRDQDSLFVGTDWGEGSLTNSGYPRIVKLWKRGEPLASARTLIEGQREDVSLGGFTSFNPVRSESFLYRAISFYETEYWHVASDGTQTRIPIPLDATFVGLFNDEVIFQLKSDWREGSSPTREKFPQGAVLSGSLTDLLTHGRFKKVRVVIAPSERMAVLDVVQSQDALYVNLLENVRGKLLKIRDVNGAWRPQELDFDKTGSLSIVSHGGLESDLLVAYEDFLNPAQLYFLSGASGKKRLLRSLPPQFDSSGLVVRQSHATSRDGTQIPYFIIHRKGMNLNGQNPTLLYGYGGFENSLTPAYRSLSGSLWLERGGVHVVANIRGGGEFGPRWHQAALKENRQKAFDDFIAVAEHLIEKKITSAPHLGIQGGSNGGLLVGATMVQRPELFNAVICQVPLLDMLRYHKLLAGASWMGEYGNPDNPEERKYIEAYSPYQNLRRNRKYPSVLFVTSTKDDRVHPGHARKMAARMLEYGYQVVYFENIEGGHSSSANLLQLADRTALEYVYLSRQLGL